MDNFTLTPFGLSVEGITSFQKIIITSNTTLPSAAFPALSSVASSVQIASNPVLTSIDLGLLEVVVGGTGFSSNPALTSLALQSLVFIGGGFSLRGDGLLVTLNLPALIIAAPGGRDSFITDDCSSLSNVSFPNYLPSNRHTQSFHNCALSQASVDHILSRCVASIGYVTGRVDLSGGTSSPPSAAGEADKATLIARGVTVQTN